MYRPFYVILGGAVDLMPDAACSLRMFALGADRISENYSVASTSDLYLWYTYALRTA